MFKHDVPTACRRYTAGGTAVLLSSSFDPGQHPDQQLVAMRAHHASNMPERLTIRRTVTRTPRVRVTTRSTPWVRYITHETDGGRGDVARPMSEV